jgi:trigger factor
VPVQREITNLPGSAVRLTITIQKDDIAAKYKEALKEIVKQAQVKGFRKGKVPPEIVERKFGKEIQEEFVVKVISDTVQEVIREDDFPKEHLPIPEAPVKIDEEPKFDLSCDFVFSVVYDVRPEVKVDNWGGHEVTIDDVEISEADVDEAIEKIRQENVIAIDKDEPIAEGDIVSVDYRIVEKDGCAVTDDLTEDYVFTVGEHENSFDFDSDVIGISAGDTKEICKTYPKDFEDEVLAGKTIKIQLIVNSVRQNQIPALDDDFAQDVNEKFKTLKDLRAHVRKELELGLEGAITQEILQSVLENISDEIKIEVPESMIELELRFLLSELVRENNKGIGGIDEDREVADRMQAFSFMRPIVREKLKSGLLINAYKREKNISADDADFDAELERLTTELDRSLDSIKTFYIDFPDQKENLMEKIVQKKAEKMLIDENIVKKSGEKVKYSDFMGKNKGKNNE